MKEKTKQKNQYVVLIVMPSSNVYFKVWSTMKQAQEDVARMKQAFDRMEVKFKHYTIVKLPI